MLNLILIGLKAGISVAQKSPLNFWLSTLVNLFYYVANALFWYALISSGNLPTVFSLKYINLFFSTICLVDNIYLLFLGKGSLLLANRARSLKLDPHLTLPVSPQFLYIFSNFSFEHSILTALSFIYFIVVHFYYQISAYLFLIHFIMTLEGVVVLGAITWIIRSTVFWTTSLVSIKNSNPCFKVLVRPEQSFTGIVRLFLIFILPCLFITGIPASVGNNTMSSLWLITQTAVCIILVLFSKFLFNVGLKRYSKFST